MSQPVDTFRAFASKTTNGYFAAELHWIDLELVLHSYSFAMAVSKPSYNEVLANPTYDIQWLVVTANPSISEHQSRPIFTVSIAISKAPENALRSTYDCNRCA
jgi:hypothetical protein